jgi:hypothetical protein
MRVTLAGKSKDGSGICCDILGQRPAQTHIPVASGSWPINDGDHPCLVSCVAIELESELPKILDIFVVVLPFECHLGGMKIIGTVTRSQLEGGQWILETAKGDRYQLQGAVKELKDGMRAELTGDIDRNMMGFGMAGINFVVKTVAVASGNATTDAKAKAKPASKTKPKK